jgi:hypothetical protein
VLAFANWRDIAQHQPANPVDPADPAYDFGRLDATVRDAAARGLDVVLPASLAPPFAEGPNRPPDVAVGTWRPDPNAFGQFATALATRYSGSFVPPGAATPLPRVKYFQAWTEPNLFNHLTPQYAADGSNSGPEIFRSLLNAFFAGVKQVHSDNLVITGATGPYGDEPGGLRTRPLTFWRHVLCLSDNLKSLPCPSKADFDLFAHNPINTSGGPTTSAVDPDDSATPDFKDLRKILRAAERHHTTGTAGKHPMWATEIWWETDPPDPTQGVSLKTQARYLEQALYILYKQGARAVVNLQLQDTPFNPDNPFGESATGILFADGSPKPSATAWRFPLVADRKGKSKLLVWGRSPASGKLAIERRQGGHWRRVASLRVKQGEVFQRRITGHSRAAVRASVAGEHSLPWKHR